MFASFTPLLPQPARPVPVPGTFPPNLAADITSYVSRLQPMTPTAALTGLGLTTEAGRSHLNGYIQGLMTANLDIPTMESSVSAFLQILAPTPPVAVPSLWKSVAIKAIISWVQCGGSLTGLVPWPVDQQFLDCIGDAPLLPHEMVETWSNSSSTDEYSSDESSDEMVVNTGPDDPFVDGPGPDQQVGGLHGRNLHQGGFGRIFNREQATPCPHGHSDGANIGLTLGNNAGMAIPEPDVQMPLLEAQDPFQDPYDMDAP